MLNLCSHCFPKKSLAKLTIELFHFSDGSFMSLLSLIFICCSGDGVPPAFPAAAVSSALPAPAGFPL